MGTPLFAWLSVPVTDSVERDVTKVTYAVREETYDDDRGGSVLAAPRSAQPGDGMRAVPPRERDASPHQGDDARASTVHTRVQGETYDDDPGAPADVPGVGDD